MRFIRSDYNRRGRFDPGRSSSFSPGEIEDVIPGAKFAAPFSSIPATDEGVPVPDEESSAPCDDFSPPGNFPPLMQSVLDLRSWFPSRCRRHDPG